MLQTIQLKFPSSHSASATYRGHFSHEFHLTQRGLLSSIWCFWHMRQLSDNMLLTFHIIFSSPLYCHTPLFMKPNTVDAWGHTLNYYQLKCTWRTISILWWFCLCVCVLLCVPFIAVVDVNYIPRQYLGDRMKGKVFKFHDDKAKFLFLVCGLSFIYSKMVSYSEACPSSHLILSYQGFCMEGKGKPQTLVHEYGNHFYDEKPNAFRWSFSVKHLNNSLKSLRSLPKNWKRQAVYMKLYKFIIKRLILLENLLWFLILL